MVDKNNNGTFVLIRKHTRNGGVECEFLRFVANGAEVEVTKYENSDLVWERTHGRHQARHIWQTAVDQGYTRTR